MQACRAVVFCLFLSSAHASATTYYVSPAGSDGNPGTSAASSFRTIQRAVNTAVAGDVVYVRRGTYREQIEMKRGGAAGNPLRLYAYPGEVPVIKGSDIVTGWVQDSPAVWKKTAWPHNSQQVFVDFDRAPKPSLQQVGMPSPLYTSWEYPNPVGSGRSGMTAGSFYYDAAAQTLYVRLKDGSDPNRHVMEASVRRRLLFMTQPYVHARGLAFRHSSASAFVQQGAAVELSSYSVIEACDIQFTDFAGLGMGFLQTNTQALGCNVSNNGNSGIAAVGATNFLVSNATLNGNNTRNFNALWHAGGFKGTEKTYGILQDSEVGFNNGSGVWFDYANSGGQIVIRNNYIHDNGPVDSAIFLEVSSNGLVYNNVLVNNRRRGIYVSASSNMLVYNNTVVATAGRAALEVAGMPRGSATLTNNVLYNNVVSHGSSQYDLYFQPENGTTIAGNRSDHNAIHRAAGSISLWSGSQYSDLASWRAATKLDLGSISADPLYAGATTPPSASGYALTSGSPLIDAGFSVGSAVPNDYLHMPRPAGKAFDIGAFEAPAPVAADTTAPVVAIAGASSVVGSSLTISASASDNVGVTGMSLYLHGVLKASSSAGQISYQWTTLSAGAFVIRVTARDAAGNTGEATATLMVQ